MNKSSIDEFDGHDKRKTSTVILPADSGHVMPAKAKINVRHGNVPAMQDGIQSQMPTSAEGATRVMTPSGPGTYADKACGEVLGGRYRLDSCIGRGGMAIVYQGIDQTLDRPVAVKMMLPQYAEDDQFKERFYLEAKSAAQLQSPNIVSVYDWGFDKPTGSYYIVMELLDGMTLKEAIQEHAPLSCQTTAEIAMQICDGLQDAHDHGIIHRDIKPQNIMLLRNKLAKIMDFGIARPSDVHITTGSNVLGTAQYISPEQTRGMEVTAASDIYSLGVVMYECVTGHVPFDGNDAVTVALKQAREAPVPPADDTPAVDQVMNRIILKCMEKSPEGRFASASELKDTLAAYVAGQSPDVSLTQTVMPPLPADGTKKPGTKELTKSDRRRKAIIGIAIAVMVAVIGVTTAIVWSNAETAREAAAANANMTSVPNVVGMSLNKAKRAIDDAGLSVGKVKKEYSDDVSKGDVISQSVTPDDGRQRLGKSIDLVVSKGPEPPQTAVVPSVTGQSVDTAKATLEQLGFKVSIAYGNSDTISSGDVMEQDPASNTTLQVGGTVTLTVSKGADMVTVPDLTGKTQAAAQAALTADGLALGKVSQSPSDDVEKGNVMSQGTDSGTSVKRGSTVDITVSTGKETINIGSLGLIGKTLAEAKNALNTYGIVATISGSSSLSSVVQDISPTTVTKGGTVTLTTVATDADNANANAGSGTQGNGSGNATNNAPTSTNAA